MMKTRTHFETTRIKVEIKCLITPVKCQRPNRKIGNWNKGDGRSSDVTCVAIPALRYAGTHTTFFLWPERLKCARKAGCQNGRCQNGMARTVAVPERLVFVQTAAESNRSTEPMFPSYTYRWKCNFTVFEYSLGETRIGTNA